MLWTKLAVIAVAGAIGAAMVNRGVAVFHDGLRALMPELLEGRMSRLQVTQAAFGLSFGLWLGFGIPFSLASTILMTHSLWLGTDIIGTWFPGPCGSQEGASSTSRWGLANAALAGALYGGLLVLGLEGLAAVFDHLPIQFLGAMGQLSGPVLVTFAAFPALAVAYQYGIKHGLLAFLITLLVRQSAGALGLAQPDSWALGVGLLVLLVYAVREKKGEPMADDLAALSVPRSRRIRGYLPAIAMLGAVYGLACNMRFLMEGPQALLALAQGERGAAIGITFARALSFAPLKAMSGLATGVFAMDGYGFVAVAGLAAPNAVVAAVAGAIVMSLEAWSIVLVNRFLERFPAILQAIDGIRTSMTKLLEVASLVGGLMAANSIAPTLGLFGATGLYLLNEVAGTPIMRVAIGPVAVIVVGIVANLLAWLRLYGPVV